MCLLKKALIEPQGAVLSLSALIVIVSAGYQSESPLLPLYQVIWLLGRSRQVTVDNIAEKILSQCRMVLFQVFIFTEPLSDKTKQLQMITKRFVHRVDGQSMNMELCLLQQRLHFRG